VIPFGVSSITGNTRTFVPEKVEEEQNKWNRKKTKNNTLRKCENKYIPFCAAISSRTLVIQDLEGKVHS
jgi:hypothetical protein